MIYQVDEKTFIRVANLVLFPNLPLNWCQRKVVGGVVDTYFEDGKQNIVVISTVDESTVEFTKFFIDVFNFGAKLVDTEDLAKY